jgi:hypothetical protein
VRGLPLLVKANYAAIGAARGVAVAYGNGYGHHVRRAVLLSRGSSLLD